MPEDFSLAQHVTESSLLILQDRAVFPREEHASRTRQAQGPFLVVPQLSPIKDFRKTVT